MLLIAAENDRDGIDFGPHPKQLFYFQLKKTAKEIILSGCLEIASAPKEDILSVLAEGTPPRAFNLFPCTATRK